MIGSEFLFVQGTWENSFPSWCTCGTMCIPHPKWDFHPEPVGSGRKIKSSVPEGVGSNEWWFLTRWVNV